MLPRRIPYRDWLDHAACANEGWEPFFDDQDPQTALRLCEGCPVRVHCLRFALENQIDTGVWGGMRAEARRTLRPSQLAA